MRSKQGLWTAAGLGVGLLLSGGCSQAMTDAFFATSVAESRQFNDVTIDAVKEHDTNMTEQHKAMSPEAAEAIDKLKADFDAKVVDLKKRADDIHSNVGDNLNKLVAMGLKIAMPDGGTVAGFVSNLVGTETDKVRTKTEEVRTAMLASFKDQGNRVNEEEKARMAAIAAMEKEMAAGLAALSKETQSKLAGTTQETFDNLVAFKDDRAAFERTLREELKLTPAEMEELKGMTTEQILALIAAAGGAAGIGVAGGRSGKSRGAGDLDKVKEGMARMAADIERAKPPLA